MRIVFMGTPDFALPTLKALHDSEHDVALVVAQPNRRSGRGQRTQSPPTIRFAKEHGLSTAQPKAVRSGPFPERLSALGHDVSVVIAYGRILPAPLIDSGKFGAINLHASLLPRWRGAAPVNHAILAGDGVTGVCSQQMEPTLDTGPLYVCRTLDIQERETAASLHDRLASLAAEVTMETLPLLGRAVPTPQDEAQATWAPKISREDGRIDWSTSAPAIDRRIRAMAPWPGAWCAYAGDFLKIRAASCFDGSTDHAEPGTVVSVRPLVVACGEGALRLDRVQAPGRKEAAGEDFANGHRLNVGQTLSG